MKKNILLIQMHSVIGDKKANYAKVEHLIEEFYSANANQNPDIIILPEVWTTGWYCPIFGELSETSSETEDFLSGLAKKHKVNIIGGSYIKKTDIGIKNTCPCFNRYGELIARYEKIHLYAPDGEAQFVTSGKKPVIVNIEGINIGLSICYDIRFPELFRSYINSSCPPELLINMSAWPKTRLLHYRVLSQARAVENQCYFIGLSQTGLIKDEIYNAGNSLIAAPSGEIIAMADESESAVFASIDFDEVKKIRRLYPNLSNRKIFDFGFCVEILKGEACV